MHGPTYMANPLACQVAQTSMALMQKNNWQSCVKQIEKWLWQGLQDCEQFPEVKAVRVLGAIGVVELKQAVNRTHLQHYFLTQGTWIRPLQNLIYLMPPYIANADDIAHLTRVIYQAL